MGSALNTDSFNDYTLRASDASGHMLVIKAAKVGKTSKVSAFPVLTALQGTCGSVPVRNCSEARLVNLSREVMPLRFRVSQQEDKFSVSPNS